MCLYKLQANISLHKTLTHTYLHTNTVNSILVSNVLLRNQNYLKLRNRERSSFHCSLLIWPLWSWLSHVKPGGKRFIQVSTHFLPGSARVPNTWTMFYCFFYDISKDLDQKSSTRDMNQLLGGILALLASALHAMPQCQPLYDSQYLCYITTVKRKPLLISLLDRFKAIWITDFLKRNRSDESEKTFKPSTMSLKKS